MSKLEKAKEVIKENLKDARCGIFDCSGCASDTVIDIYKDANLVIRICYYYEYFEVFGLSTEEFAELEDYYESLKE